MSLSQINTGYFVFVSILVVVFAFLKSMKNLENTKGKEYADVIYGVWVEVLFTFFPFIVYFTVGAFKNNVSQLLQTPELAVASSILCGQGLLKLFRAVIGSESKGLRKEVLGFFFVIALLVFTIAISLIILITAMDNVPDFVGVVQLVLITVSLPLYSGLAGSAVLIEKSMYK